MCRLLNSIEKILLIIFSCLYFCSFSFQDTLLKQILVLIFSVLIFSTSLVDLFKYKKLNLETHILNVVLILILLLNIIRPVFDNLLIRDLEFNFDLIFYYTMSLLEQNFLLITIFMIILFILNIKFKKFN